MAQMGDNAPLKREGIEITGSAKITVNGSAVSIPPPDVVVDITAGSEPLSGFVRRGSK
jgi:hypothetical protein